MSSSLSARFHELKATGELPSPTGVALTLLELTQRDDVTVDEISNVLQADPALAGRLLKFANSPYVGRRRPVAAVSDAVLLVGMHVVRQIVLSLSVLSANRSGRCSEFDYQTFWAASLATGVAIEALCARDRAYPPEEGFACGLLAGVGRLALASVYPKDYAEVLRRHAGCPATELVDSEQEIFLIDHLDLSAAMLEDWGLPAIQIEAVRGMYAPDQTRSSTERGRRLKLYLHIAARMARICVGNQAIRDELTPGLLESAANCGMDADTFSKLFDEVVEQWRDWATILEVTPGQVPPFAELLGHAKEALSNVAAEYPAPHATPLRILLVDDDPLTLEVVGAELSRAGHEVLFATDGRDGLHLAMHENVQLVITDWLMPEMDGIDFCKALRSSRDGQRMYVIILTAQDDDMRLIEAFDAGADDYIVKPVRPDVLHARLRGGERLIRLQTEVEREREENRQYLAELAVANRRLEQAALTDVLTSLPNRRYATRRLHQIWAASKRYNMPFTCMLIDIDHFKSINDTYGHLHGDTILCEVAKILRGAARSDDEVCRIGGEEFLVICSNSDAQSSLATAERLRAAVETHHLNLPGYRQRLTISIGVAVRNANDADPDTLLKAADNAVYAAKRLGRNRVCTLGDAAPNGKPTLVVSNAGKASHSLG